MQPPLPHRRGPGDTVSEPRTVGVAVESRRSPGGLTSLVATNLAFRRSWTASTLSMMGTRTLSVAYPMLAITLTGSPSWTGWVVCAATLPGLLCYLPAGTVVDRLGPRLVMTWCELAKGLLMAVTCGALLLGGLEIGHLLVIAFAEGCLAVFSSVAEIALIPAVARPAEVGTALAVHETTVHAVGLTGRSLGGVLYACGPAVVFLANAVAFLSAAGTMARTPVRETPVRPVRLSLMDEIRVGLREIWGNDFLRSATILTALINLVVQALTVVFVTHMTQTRESPALIGVILAAAGVGGVAGALISPQRQRIAGKVPAYRLAEWIGLTRRGRSMLLVHTWMCAAALLLALTTALAPSAFALALLMIGLAGGLSNVTIRTVISRVPADKLARVAGVSRLVSYGGGALGPLLAGLLYASADVWVTAATLTVAMFSLALAATVVRPFRKGLSPGWPPQKA
ncbi:MFS transporter [Nonomuraea sp. M3C6]|uniref:MFS transporter n=1 Tax=Nonomuraea marmarensis TaxID=3351344 RepID=A0ABW7ABU8_9ACTN